MSIHPTHLDHSDDQPEDRGSAMILTLMVMALVTVLSTTVAVVTINNLQSSWRSRQSGAALSAADAGIAQAVSYLRSAGVGDLQCSPSACKADWWGNKTSPIVVPMPGMADQSYEVWIEPVAAFPQNDPGLYRIHSTGLAAGGASRPVTADVSITTTDGGVPKGIFAPTVFGGPSSVSGQSIFSTGCVSMRKQIEMTPGGIDLAYGIPAAVHSSGMITDKNSCSKNQSIHASKSCDADNPYDQDLHGGLLKAADGCHKTEMTETGEWGKYYSTYDLNADGKKDPSSLLKSPDDMYDIFGFQPVLSSGHLETLKMLAQAQGNYHTSASDWSAPTKTDNEVVIFFDLKKGGNVSLNGLGSKFDREVTDAVTGPACPTKSLTIVVEGGDVSMNANKTLAATLILTEDGFPSGDVDKFNGNAKFIGTIYAGSVNLRGQAKVVMDKCFLANPGPGLTDIAVTSYREHDRGLS